MQYLHLVCVVATPLYEMINITKLLRQIAKFVLDIAAI